MVSKMTDAKWRWGVLALALVLAAVAVVGALALKGGDEAKAQPIQFHGITIQKVCSSPSKVGDTTECSIRITNADDFGDTIEVHEAWDVQDAGDDAVRVPAVGNLPISSVDGNALCAAGPALPCLIGAPGSTLSGLPGDPAAGSVTFLSNEYVVQLDDPDPLTDQGNVVWHDHCDSPTTTGCATVFNIAQAPAAINLVQPAIAVDKTGDSISKLGDEIDYTVTLSNNSSADTPPLDCDATDTLAGPIFSGGLPLGDTIINYSITAPAGPDPLVNTVTLNCTVEGLGNVLEATDSHEVNLVQPAIAVDKTGDSISKEGDQIGYVVTLSNNSSPDTPPLDCTATDTLAGPIFGGVLPLGNTVINYNIIAPAGPDPLVNTVTLTCTVRDLGNLLEASDSHEVNLVQPAIAVDKTGDAFSKEGDLIDYTVTLGNNSSPDTPVLNCTATDTLAGIIYGPAPLPLGNTVVSYTMPAPAGPDPLVNTVTLNCTVGLLGNELTATDSHEVDLVHPDFTIVKACSPDPVSVGGTITWEVTLTNTGDVALDILVEDPVAGISEAVALGAGDTTTLTRSRVVVAGDAPSITNTVTATATLPPEFELSNRITKTATSTCEVQAVFEGCTPGYWKQPQHFDSWVGYSPGQSFEAVFGRDVPGNPTLLQALNLGGGGLNALMRHSVSALLNASSPDVDYAFSVAEVIAKFQAAFDSGDYETQKNEFDFANNAGCPLN